MSRCSTVGTLLTPPMLHHAGDNLPAGRAGPAAGRASAVARRRTAAYAERSAPAGGIRAARLVCLSPSVFCQCLTVAAAAVGSGRTMRGGACRVRGKLCTETGGRGMPLAAGPDPAARWRRGAGRWPERHGFG